jgi:hypothetical protein
MPASAYGRMMGRLEADRSGGMFTKWAQDRQWLRDQEIAAYRDLLGHFARFSMEINRAQLGRRGWDYDWGGGAPRWWRPACGAG